MTVSFFLETAGRIIEFSANPSKAFDCFKDLWESAFKQEPQPEGLSLASSLNTIHGIGWNCMVVPAEGAALAGINFLMIRHILKKFVEPEPESAKDRIISAISFIASSIISYKASESFGYAEVPHLNPEYDTKCISIAAGLAGAAIATLYCTTQRLPEKVEKKPEESFFWGLLNRVTKEN